MYGIMEKLEGYSPQPLSYSQNLTKLYKEVKKSDRLLTNQKIVIFVNKEGDFKVFKNKQEANFKNSKS